MENKTQERAGFSIEMKHSGSYAEKRNVLPQLLPRRINKRLQALAEYIWDSKTSVTVYGGPVRTVFADVKSAQRQTMTKVLPGEYFGPPHPVNDDVPEWQQRWFRVDIAAAAQDEAGRRFLYWDCMGETTVYIDDVPWAGLDVAHPHCPLPDGACTLWLDCGCYQTAVWASGKKPDDNGLRFDGAYIMCRNETAWETYWDIDVLFRVLRYLADTGGLDLFPAKGKVSELRRCHPVLRILIDRLNGVCNTFDLYGIEAMKYELQSIYRDLPAEGWQLSLTALGHSHLDHVWYWPESIGERKGLHTAVNALQMLERYPEFHFMWTSPAMYEAIRKHSPELYERICRYIKQGRWEATGGMWVEADNHVPCGEALARSLVLGQRYFASLRDGEISNTVWLPDVFGYNTCLPQIMKEAGITSFSTTKLRWSSVTEFPFDSFVWRGLDGSEVLTHMATLSSNECDPSVYATINRSYQERAVHDEVLRAEGFGDGGGGPSEGACERLRRIHNLTQVPRAQWGKAEEFFSRMEKVRERLPVYEGELYLELHQGTFTTQGHFKKAYREAEKGLQTLEAAHVIKNKGPVEEESWRRLLLAQFHDALPGTSVGDYYKESIPELENLATESRQQASKAVTSAPEGAEEVVFLFNPASITTRTVVEITESEMQSEARADHKNIQQSTDENGELCMLAAVELPPLSVKSLGTAQLKIVDDWEVAETVLDNGITRAEFHADGQLTRLLVDGSEIPLTEPAFFTLYSDSPASYEAWDIDQASLKLGRQVAPPMDLKVIENGPVRARLRGRCQLEENSYMTIDYILTAHYPWLQVHLDVDWYAEKKLLKYHLPTAYKGYYARYGCPFGSVLRSQTADGPKNEAMWEVPGSRWAALGNDIGDRGVAILTESKYGFSCRDGDLALSLLRAPKKPDPGCDMGRHRIRFAVGMHRPRKEAGRLNTAAAADMLYTPVLKGAYGSELSSPFRVEGGDTLVPAWSMPASDANGFVIRMHETMGEYGSAVLTCSGETVNVSYVNLLEEMTGEPIRLSRNKFRIHYTPYQVVSLLVTGSNF